MTQPMLCTSLGKRQPGTMDRRRGCSISWGPSHSRVHTGLLTSLSWLIMTDRSVGKHIDELLIMWTRSPSVQATLENKVTVFFKVFALLLSFVVKVLSFVPLTCSARMKRWRLIRDRVKTWRLTIRSHSRCRQAIEKKKVNDLNKTKESSAYTLHRYCLHKEISPIDLFLRG
jgi:hypothetical protein